jgi:glucan phosphoethanolaminetransferase (alkaline phosphatase superfamily)
MNPFFRALQQPEYLHILLNPLPVYGLALGLIALLFALFLRDRRAHLTALSIVFIAAVSAWPVAHYGEEAYDRVLSMSDQDGDAWLASHAHRADKFVWLYYALAVIAALALILPRKFPRTGLPLIIAALVLGCVSLAAGSYIAYAGGKVRHREFRNEPPPPKPPERD